MLKTGGAQKNLRESFCYDGLNRLIKSHSGDLNGTCALNTAQQDVEYDGLGNITRKAGVGNYSYSGKGPHAVTAVTGMAAFTYDNNGNQLEANGRGIHYTTYDQPLSIYKLSNQGERVHFDYNGHRSRYQRLDIANGSANTLTHYLGNVERIETLTGSGAGIVELKKISGIFLNAEGGPQGEALGWGE